MKYTYWQDNVLMVGKMKSGKTYNSKKLISTANKANVIVLDAHPHDSGFKELADKIIVSERPFDAKWIDLTVEVAYKYAAERKHKAKMCVVFDDLDLYVTSVQDSKALKDWFIDSRHDLMGSIVQSKRVAYLDKRILQGSKYIFMFKGIILTDFNKLVDECSLDYEGLAVEYTKVAESSDDAHKFVLVDNDAKTFKVLSNIELKPAGV